MCEINSASGGEGGGEKSFVRYFHAKRFTHNLYFIILYNIHTLEKHYCQLLSEISTLLAV